MRKLVGVRLEVSIIRRLKAALALKGLTLTEWVEAQANQLLAR